MLELAIGGWLIGWMLVCIHERIQHGSLPIIFYLAFLLIWPLVILTSIEL